MFLFCFQTNYHCFIQHLIIAYYLSYIYQIIKSLSFAMNLQYLKVYLEILIINRNAFVMFYRIAFLKVNIEYLDHQQSYQIQQPYYQKFICQIYHKEFLFLWIFDTHWSLDFILNFHPHHWKTNLPCKNPISTSII